VVYCKKLIIGGHTHEAHQDSRYQESLQVRKERRLRRMPDFLPVRMQDQLRYRKPEVRKQGKVIAKRNAAIAQLLIKKLGSFIRLRRVILLCSDIRHTPSDIRCASDYGE
jgi:hypothetical protein